MTPPQTRNTPLKKAMIEVLTTHHMLSAPQLVQELHTLGHKVNKTSVYRNLAAYLKSGVVCQHTFTGAEIVYELQAHHHDHIFCTQCGKIEALECSTTIPTNTQGFEIHHHHLTLFGICADCQRG